MKKIKNETLKILYSLIGIVLAVSFIFLGVVLINSNNKFSTISCITKLTLDGESYENSTYGGKVTINGFAMGDKTTFQLKVGQNVNLNSVANVGFLFVGYYCDDVLLSTKQNYDFKISQNQNKDICAKFAKAVSLNLNITNPFNHNDVRQIEEVCYVGQEVVVSQLVAKSCGLAWADYYQNSTPRESEGCCNVVCKKNSITVGTQSSNLIVEPTLPSNVGEEPLKYILTYHYIDSDGVLQTFQDDESIEISPDDVDNLIGDEGHIINIDKVPNKEVVFNGKTFVFAGFSDIQNDYVPKYANDILPLPASITLQGVPVDLYAVYSKKITLTYFADKAENTPEEVDLDLCCSAGIEDINHQTLTHTLSDNVLFLADNIMIDGWIYKDKFYDLGASIILDENCTVYANWAVSDNNLEGDGTLNEPYLISDETDFLTFALGVKVGMFLQENIYFTQTHNIDFTRYNIFVGEYDFKTQTQNNFKGVYDGNNKTLSVNINKPNNDYIGIFSVNKGAIKNLGVVDSVIWGRDNIGVIAGNNLGIIENCYSKASLEGSGSCIGGLVGENKGKINHCANLGTIQASKAVSGVSVGGLVGKNLQEGTVDNSYSISNVNAKNYQFVGGLVGENYGSLTNSGNAGNIYGKSFVGGLVGQNYGSLLNCYNFGTVNSVNSYYGGVAGCNSGEIYYTYYLENCAKNENGTVQNAVGSDNNLVLISDVEFKTTRFSNSGQFDSAIVIFEKFVNNVQDALNAYVLFEREEEDHKFYDSWASFGKSYLTLGCAENIWDGINYKEIEKGNGTIENPYQIENAFQLKYLSNQPTKNKFYILTSDIYLNNFDIQSYSPNFLNTWLPIENFYGNLDGQNFAIYGLYINTNLLSNQGLFTTNYGTIQNLVLVDGYVEAVDNVGAFCGSLGSEGIVKSCHNYCKVTGVGENVGGIIGNNAGLIDSCKNMGNVNAQNKNVGGIAGSSYRDIINSSNLGNVECPQTNVGGIVGATKFNSNVINCFNLGEVRGGSSCVGGIVGHNEQGYIKNTYSSGAVTGLCDFTGAIVGKNDGNESIQYSYYLINSSTCGDSLYQQGVGNSTNDNVDEDGKTTVFDQNLSTKAVVIGDKTFSSLKENLEAWVDVNSSFYGKGYSHWETKDNQIVLAYAWQGGYCLGYSGGDGTKENPYKISTANDLGFLAYQVNNGNHYENTYFVMTNNIYLNDETFVFDIDTGLVKVSDGYHTAYLGTGILGQNIGWNSNFDFSASKLGTWYGSDQSKTNSKYYGKLKEWTPIGQVNKWADFAGEFDGCNHLISGLYINGGAINVGLFGNVTGTIKNLGIINSYVCGSQNVAGMVATNNGTLINCFNDAVVISTDKTAGGLVGTLENGSYIHNSYNIGLVCAPTSAGGISGITNGSINNVYNWGFVFAGKSKGKVCDNISSIAQLSNIFVWGGSASFNEKFLTTVSNQEEITEAQLQLNTYATNNNLRIWQIDNETGKPSFD